ncbi:class I SAM-dependent DNA methyltransferase [Streptomyces sp. NPDC058045]|uniref:class I SAM-dependent DNA methyltransferase n=1 Tax=Streptomyces sp. NPDC058045 TaxID=3346311 RepID=UPI0036E68B6E
MSEGSEAFLEYGTLVPDRTGQADAFDAIGERYDDAFPHKEGQIAAAKWLAEELAPGSRVLDLGCGTGLPTARQLVAAGHRVLGVDLSPGMVEQARRNVPEAEFRAVDLAELRPGGPDGVGEFDGVAAFFSLLMLPRDEIPYALRLVHRLLRPGGLFALSMVEADLDDEEIPFLGHPIRVSGFLRDDLLRVVRDAGFEVVGEDAFAYAPATTGAPPEHQLFLNCRRA